MSAALLRVENRTRSCLLGGRVRRANRPWSRARGLLGRRSLEEGEGLVLLPGTSIHTLFMRFAIDVLYVDRDDRVVKVVQGLKPFRFSGCRRGAHYVVELPIGTIERSGTEPGDQLALLPVDGAVSDEAPE